MEIIRNEMAVAQLEVNEKLIDRNELELFLTQAELFIIRLEPLYRSFSTANKRRFITLVFPKGVVYENGKVEPVKKSLLFEYLGDLQDQKLATDEMVTLTLPHPNQIIADILDLFNTFASDLRGLSYNLAV